MDADTATVLGQFGVGGIILWFLFRDIVPRLFKLADKGGKSADVQLLQASVARLDARVQELDLKSQKLEISVTRTMTEATTLLSSMKERLDRRDQGAK